MYCLLYIIFYLFKSGLLCLICISENHQTSTYLEHRNGKFLYIIKGYKHPYHEAKYISEETAFRLLHQDLDEKLIDNYLSCFDPSMIDFEAICNKCENNEFIIIQSNKEVNCRFWNEGFTCFWNCPYRQDSVTVEELVAELNFRILNK